MSGKPGIDDVQTLRKQLKQGRADGLMKVSASAELPYPRNSATNAELLIRILEPFVDDEHKFTFLPTPIRTHILSELQELRALMPGAETENGWSAKSPEELTALLLRFDAFYAYCLQYGIISFGFNSKVAQEHIAEIRSVVEVAKKGARSLETDLERLKQEAITNGQKHVEAIVELQKRLTEEMQPSVDAVKSAADTAKQQVSEAADKTLALNKLVEDSQRSNEAITNSAMHAASMEESIGLSQKNVQSFESTAKDAAASAKAMENTITEAKANANEQLEAIGKFFGNIESYKQEMIKTKKDSQAGFNELKSTSEGTIADFTTRTEKIVSDNESMVDQIKDHLRKAIGVSLFTAFDTRRWRISFARWVWTLLLFASVAGVVYYAYWFVDHLADITKGTDKAVDPILLYARLAMVIPLGFLVGFATKQYARERRAEEEWAFKSAVSVSLEPYRDLIARMKKDGDDTTFVEQLVLEIFDNPAKRLYAAGGEREEKSKPDVLALVRELIDKIPKAE